MSRKFSCDWFQVSAALETSYKHFNNCDMTPETCGRSPVINTWLMVNGGFHSEQELRDTALIFLLWVEEANFRHLKNDCCYTNHTSTPASAIFWRCFFISWQRKLSAPWAHYIQPYVVLVVEKNGQHDSNCHFIVRYWFGYVQKYHFL